MTEDELRKENTRLTEALAVERESHRRLAIAYAELRRLAGGVVTRQKAGFPVIVVVGELAKHLEGKR